jgi:hypothetical protein
VQCVNFYQFGLSDLSSQAKKENTAATQLVRDLTDLTIQNKQLVKNLSLHLKLRIFITCEKSSKKKLH